MRRIDLELIVGLFILVGIIALGYISVKLGKMEWFGSDRYPVVARFQSISGLKEGANVEMAGVEIGKVESIELDPERQIAVVTMQIQKGVELTEDVIASVKTAGMIGDKYIKLTPGGSEDILKPGDMIEETESAVDLEELISKYVFGDA